MGGSTGTVDGGLDDGLHRNWVTWFKLPVRIAPGNNEEVCGISSYD
jgi:hypothetical protein